MMKKFLFLERSVDLFTYCVIFFIRINDKELHTRHGGK